MDRTGTSSHRFQFPSRRVLLGLAAAIALDGCGNDASNIELPPLQITTSTTGSSFDPDGYMASVDGGSPLAVGVNDTVIVGDAASGAHVVELSGVASNCPVRGSSSDTVTVSGGTTTDAAFAVTCAPLPAGDGQIVVTTTTSGSTDGSVTYAILLDGRRIGSIGPNGTATAGGIAAGSHTVGLDSLPAGFLRISGGRGDRGMDHGGRIESSAAVRCVGKRGGRLLGGGYRCEGREGRGDRALRWYRVGRGAAPR